MGSVRFIYTEQGAMLLVETRLRETQIFVDHCFAQLFCQSSVQLFPPLIGSEWFMAGIRSDKFLH